MSDISDMSFSKERENLLIIVLSVSDFVKFIKLKVQFRFKYHWKSC